jgi:hypothetical protein
MFLAPTNPTIILSFAEVFLLLAIDNPGTIPLAPAAASLEVLDIKVRRLDFIRIIIKNIDKEFPINVLNSFGFTKPRLLKNFYYEVTL